MAILSGSVYNYVSKILPSLSGNYFEIGVFNGDGFARIAKENLDKKCYAVDPFIEDGHTIAVSRVNTGSTLTEQKQNFLENTKNLDNIVLFEMTSTQYLEQLTDQECHDMDISAVVIDGDHHYPHVMIDFEIAISLLGNKKGQIIVDDTDIDDVKRAYNEFVQKYSHRIEREVDADGATKTILLKEIE